VRSLFKLDRQSRPLPRPLTNRVGPAVPRSCRSGRCSSRAIQRCSWPARAGIRRSTSRQTRPKRIAAFALAPFSGSTRLARGRGSGRDWRSSLNRERTGHASHTLPCRMTHNVAARRVFLKSDVKRSRWSVCVVGGQLASLFRSPDLTVATCSSSSTEHSGSEAPPPFPW
jgi:hypothetical protein